MMPTLDLEGAPTPGTGGPRSSLGAGFVGRLLIALPWIAFALVVITFGDWIWATTVACFAILAIHELFSLQRIYRPIDMAGYLGAVGLIAVAKLWGPLALAPALMAVLAVTFLLTLVRGQHKQTTVTIAVTFLGTAWIGVSLAHAVLVRELPHGSGILVTILAATFVGDTAAYLGGKLWGRTPLAKNISPNKTVEGLFVGVLGALLAAWFAGIYQDWISAPESLMIGLAVALSAPLGDLFESLIKRDLEIKDSGSFFGSHGGVLDRLDAVMFAVVAGYYVARTLLLV